MTAVSLTSENQTICACPLEVQTAVSATCMAPNRAGLTASGGGVSIDDVVASRAVSTLFAGEKQHHIRYFFGLSIALHRRCTNSAPRQRQTIGLLTRSSMLVASAPLMPVDANQPSGGSHHHQKKDSPRPRHRWDARLGPGQTFRLEVITPKQTPGSPP